MLSKLYLVRLKYKVVWGQGYEAPPKYLLYIAIVIEIEKDWYTLIEQSMY